MYNAQVVRRNNLVSSGSRSQRSLRWILVCLFGITLFCFLTHVGVGSQEWYLPWNTFQEVARGPHGDSVSNNIIWKLRMPRAIECVLVGALLSSVGAGFQAFFRNPLAEPYIVGSSTGAACGGALVYIFGFSTLAMQGAAFVGGFLALLLVLALGTRRGVLESHRLLLSGVVISSMLSGILSLILLGAGRDSGRVLQWLLGSLTAAQWGDLPSLFVVLIFGWFVLWRGSNSLNAYALGAESAVALGVDPSKLRWGVLLAGTGMTAVTVGTVGIIGFVGLVAPHIARRIVGVDLRRSLPISSLIGASLILISDVIAQRGAYGMELPIGVVTAIIGAPSLLILLRQER